MPWISQTAAAESRLRDEIIAAARHAPPHKIIELGHALEDEWWHAKWDRRRQYEREHWPHVDAREPAAPGGDDDE